MRASVVARARAQLRWAGPALAVLALAASAATASGSPVGPPPESHVELAGSAPVVVAVAWHTSTHASVTSVPVGSTVHPRVRVLPASGTGTPTGTVSATIYGNSSCAAPALLVGSAKALSSGVADLTQTPFTPMISGQPAVRVDYSGDGTYAAKKSLCVVLTVTKVNPSVKVRPHDADGVFKTTFPFEAGVLPRIEVGGRAGIPTGMVSVTWYSGAACTGAGVTTVATMLTPVPGSTTTAFAEQEWEQDVDASPGTHSLRANYAGSGTYNARKSACVDIVIQKAEPVFNAVLHDEDHDQPPAAVPVGTTIHARATVTGSLGTATGGTAVQYFESTNCDPGTSFGSAFKNVPGPTIDPVPFSDFKRNEPGVLSMIVSYVGNDVYKKASSGCLAVRWKATPTITLTIHDDDHHAVTTVSRGTPVHARVKVDGAFAAPTGDVEITFYKGGSCGDASASGVVGLASGVAHDDGLRFTPKSVGTFSLRAVYAGDGKYFQRNGPCVTLQSTALATPTPVPTATPDPTAPPTPAPTAPPPTAAPTPVPPPSAEPTASLEPSPPPTAVPGPSPSPAPVTAPPAATGSPSATAPPATAPPAATASPAPAPSPSADGGGLDWIGLLLLLLLIVLIAVGAFYLGGRRARQQSPR